METLSTNRFLIEGEARRAVTNSYHSVHASVVLGAVRRISVVCTIDRALSYVEGT